MNWISDNRGDKIMDLMHKIDNKVHEIRMKCAESTLNRAKFLVNEYGLKIALFYSVISFISLLVGAGAVVVLICLLLEALIL